MKFVTSFPISTIWKKEAYDSILVIVDQFTKIVQFKLVKIILNVARVAKIIINVFVKKYGLPDSIVSNRNYIFFSKFESLFYYFLNIKYKLFIAFPFQINS